MAERPRRKRRSRPGGTAPEQPAATPDRVAEQPATAPVERTAAAPRPAPDEERLTAPRIVPGVTEVGAVRFARPIVTQAVAPQRFPHVMPAGGRLGAEFSRLDAALPLLLLPVRLETRYDLDADPPLLRIRIYPDQISIDPDTSGLSQAEIDAGTAYWTAWHGTRNRARRDAAWEDLTADVGAARAGHVARTLRPTEAGAGLDFPEVAPAATDPRPRPALLPRRWLAVGYRGDEVAFTARSRPVDRKLLAGLDPDEPTWDVGDSGLAVTPGTAWMFDYERAVAKGMAITVRLDPATARRRLTTLLVVGIDETADPLAAAADLSELLESHRRSLGMAFVPQGTPTNNTAAVASGWTRAEREEAPTRARELDRARAVPGDNAAALAGGLGIDATPLRRAAHGRDPEREHARHMNVVLYETVFGTFLRDMLAIDGRPPFPPRVVTGLRTWFVRNVTGGAPLPAFRIGEQPYGVLPVRKLGGGPLDGTPAHVERIVLYLREEWRRSLANVPVLDPGRGDRAGRGSEEQLLPAVLSSEPHPARILARTFYDDDDDFWGFLAPRSWYDAIIRLLEDLHPYLYELYAAAGGVDRAYSSIDDQIEFWTRLRYVVDADDAVVHPSVKQDARDTIDAVLLLLDGFERRQRPLRFLDLPLYAGILGEEATTVISGRYASEPREWPDAGLVEPPDAEPGSQAADYLADLAARLDPAAASTLPDAFQPPLLYQVLDKTLDRLRGQRDAKRALTTLAGLDPVVLERLMRETLGLGIHRLDAWATSLASARLDELRKDRPDGLHVGAFGWVVDLEPSAAPRPSNGFVHAPSLAHAATAAVLRSAWHAHGTARAASPAAVDAGSRRIRTAAWVLDAVRQGLGLGEVLGYHFERGLHDRRLDDQIRDVRAAVLAADDESDGSPDEPVDGMALLTAWRDGRLAGYLAGIGGLRARMEAELEGLDAVFDAIGDATLFESTHHLVQGNIGRAAAMTQAINLGTHAPPELRAPRSGRGGTSVEHRVVLLLDPGGAMPDGWAGGLRDRLAPALERWLRRLVPAAATVGATAQLPDGTARPVTLDGTGLSALDAVYLAGPDASRLSPALHRVLVETHALDPGTRFDVTASGAAAVSLGEFLLLAAELRALIDGARPADARDLRPAGAAGETDTDDSGPAAALPELVAEFKTAVGGGRRPPDHAALARFGVVLDGDDPAARARLTERAGVAGRRRDPLAGRAAALFGAAVPVLPAFTAGDAAVRFDAGLATAGEVDDWLDGIGLVRPAVGRLTTAGMFADLLGGGPVEVAAGQDLVIDGEGWAAVAAPPAETGGRLSVCAVIEPGAVPDPAGPLTGLVIDQWSERIPRRDATSGVALHFDAPSNEPPQACLLATTPPGATWSLDLVLETLLETLEWSALRTVAPEDLGDYGQAIPTTFAAGRLTVWREAAV